LMEGKERFSRLTFFFFATLSHTTLAYNCHAADPTLYTGSGTLMADDFPH
jgi:hypothetical protein